MTVLISVNQRECCRINIFCFLSVKISVFNSVSLILPLIWLTYLFHEVRKLEMAVVGLKIHDLTLRALAYKALLEKQVSHYLQG